MADVVVRLKPGSRKGPLVQSAPDGSLLVFVREQAVEGRANKAAAELLADYYDVPKRAVSLVSGHKSRLKRFRITKPA